MRNNQQEFEEKKKELFEEFLQNEPDESDAERDQALENLVVELVRVQYGITDTSEERINQIRTFIKSKMAEMESNDPRLAHAVNGLNKIGRSKYGEAIKYIQELEISRKEEVSKTQRERASAPRKIDQLNELIKSFLKFKPDLTIKELLERINGLIGYGVITEITEDEIVYYQTNKSGEMPTVMNVSALRSRLSRSKKTT
jgi:uncharacterized protein YihD (DUF1040 family)